MGGIMDILTDITDTTPTDMDTTVTIWARGLLMPNPPLLLKLPLTLMPLLMLGTDTMDILDTMDTILIDMATTVTTWARGLLMPNPRLHLRLMLNLGTDIMDIPITEDIMDIPIITEDTTGARQFLPFQNSLPFFDSLLSFR